MNETKFKSYLNQSYEQIKKECLKNRTLFDDEHFPANDSSICQVKKNKFKLNAVWKRPSEFCDKEPKFIIDEINAKHVYQGELVASVPEYINIVVPKDQCFDEADYAGIFRFRFYRFGEWLEVVVDDRLPVYADQNNKLIFCRNYSNANEMYAPLLEKAYAKLNRCYEFLDGGDEVDALIDLTGGFHERFKIIKNRVKLEAEDEAAHVSKENLWPILIKSFNFKSLCGASISSKSDQNKGLVAGHAYSILNIYSLENTGTSYTLADNVERNAEATRILKLRNPSEIQTPWTGSWCSKSAEWLGLDESIKEKLDALEQNNGEFFIDFDDFALIFDNVDFVHVNLDAFFNHANNRNGISRVWKKKCFYGEWKKGDTAGGYENFWSNPQYLIDLKLENKKIEQTQSISVLLSLMQTEQVSKRLATDGSYESSNEPLNLAIFKIVNKEKLSKLRLDEHVRFSSHECKTIVSNRVYINQRETSKRLDLLPGCYLIIPSLYEKNCEMRFFLRIYVERQVFDKHVEYFKTSEPVSGFDFKKYDFYLVRALNVGQEEEKEEEDEFDSDPSILIVNKKALSKACSIM